MRMLPRLLGLSLLFCAAAVAASTSPFDPALTLSTRLGERTGAATTETATPPPAAEPQPAAQPPIDSDVFGASLFTGAFARQGAAPFNPDYVIAIGDNIQLRMWGAYELDTQFVVDPQGNIFIPHVGPVKVLGVRNQELQSHIERSIRKVFRANVSVYATLAAAQPVRVFVGGGVRRPGMYNGTSMDSLLHYLDLAGGIDPQRGSFLKVEVKRGEQLRHAANLYDFLLDGRMPLVQLADGDVIFVTPRQHTLSVEGLASNTNVFEFSGPALSLAALITLAKPLPEATHVRVVRNTGAITNVEYFPLDAAADVALGDGDAVEFTADKKLGTITVRVEGEHQSAQEYVLPYGARLGELLGHITYSERSDTAAIQLYRQSVRQRQKATLMMALRSLETAALTARSGTSDEAILRKEEAGLILQWVERAKKIEPLGQVLIADSAHRDQLLLENGDVIRVPTRDGLVLISGEVLFPNAVAYNDKLSLDDYIALAGGYTQNRKSARIILAHRDGSFVDYDGGGRDTEIRSGDEILVLPKIDVKSRQIAKDLTQILYQIAVSAKVVLGL
jgi:protein involved in polysaccharide export with SLBB domain